MIDIKDIENKIKEFLLQYKHKNCLRCDGSVRLKSKDEWKVICRWRHCKKVFSLFTGTFLNNWKKSIEIFIKIIELLFIKVNLKFIATAVNFNYKNFKLNMKILNNNCKNRFFDDFEKVGGDKIIVEIDESKFGRRKYNRGHKVEGVWVLGMVERTKKSKILLIPIPNRTKETLTELIRRYVLPGSIIYTDEWKGYSDLKKYFEHYTVNHSKGFINKENGVHTNTIEGNWSPLKRNIENRWKNKDNIYLPLALVMEKRNGSVFSFIKKYI